MAQIVVFDICSIAENIMGFPHGGGRIFMPSHMLLDGPPPILSFSGPWSPSEGSMIIEAFTTCPVIVAIPAVPSAKTIA